jgi:hypothetical protein
MATIDIRSETQLVDCTLVGDGVDNSVDSIQYNPHFTLESCAAICCQEEANLYQNY